MTKVKEGITERIVDGVAIQRVDPKMLEGVDGLNYDWCNTANHRETRLWNEWKEQGIERTMYKSIMDKTRMKRWLPIFQDTSCMRSPHASFVITSKQQKKYFESTQIRSCAFQCTRAGNLYGEEAEDLANEIKNEHSKLSQLEAPKGGWFVRTTACSPKDAQDDNGAGPHRTLKDVLLALFASERVHISMGDYSKDVTVYLFPFDQDVTVERELRVFVYKNKVTAISQYDVFNSSGTFTPMTDQQLAEVARQVDTFHENEVVPRWNGSENYILDLEYVVDSLLATETANTAIIRMIELNSFGAEMAASSSLFHWIRDYDELYSSERLCIRVRCETFEERHD